MRKKVLIIMLGFTMLFPSVSYAAENEAVIESNEDVVQEQENQDTVDKTPEEIALENSAGEEEVIVEAISTRQSNQSPCQVNFSAALPEKFGLNCYAHALNTETGITYSFPLYSENSYYQRAFVPAGTYKVTEIAVYGDNTMTYPMVVASNTKKTIDDYTFEVSGKETCDIQVTLQNYEVVDNQIQEKIEDVTGIKPENKKSESNPEEQAEETKDIAVKSTWPVEHEGSGTGKIGVEAVNAEGDQSAEYNVSVIIASNGNLGEATFYYSLDGGLNYSDPRTIPLSGRYEVPGANIAFNFNVSGLSAVKFVADDSYTCYVPDPSTKVSYTQDTKASHNLVVTTIDPSKHVFDILEANNISIVLEITKDGHFNPKDAVIDPSDIPIYKLSIDGGLTYTKEEYFPTDGIITLENQGLILTFEPKNDASGIDYRFSKGAKLKCSAIRIKETDFTPILFGMAIAAFTGLMAIIAVMKSKIPKPSVYRFNPYTPVVIPESRTRVKAKPAKVKKRK